MCVGVVVVHVTYTVARGGCTKSLAHVTLPLAVQLAFDAAVNLTATAASGLLGYAFTYTVNM